MMFGQTFRNIDLLYKDEDVITDNNMQEMFDDLDL